MKGISSECSICGAPGKTYGSPSYFDRCVDESACLMRVQEQRDRTKKALKQAKKEEKTIFEQLSIQFQYYGRYPSAARLIEHDKNGHVVNSYMISLDVAKVLVRFGIKSTKR